MLWPPHVYLMHVKVSQPIVRRKSKIGKRALGPAHCAAATHTAAVPFRLLCHLLHGYMDMRVAAPARLEVPGWKCAQGKNYCTVGRTTESVRRTLMAPRVHEFLAERE